MMRPLLLATLLLWQANPAPSPVAQPEYLRYQRAISTPHGSGQACAALDAAVFAHAAPSLADLRLFPATATATAHELPYVITVSQSATDDTEPARILDLGSAGAHRIVFDLAMPPRAYSSVILTLAAHDFLATATVSGEPAPNAPPAQRTALGSFTLFDLTTQHLSHNTTLPLVESTFPFLHVELAPTPAPGSRTTAAELSPAIVTAAQVPPSRSAQTVYTTVASTTAITTRDRETHATLDIPAHVPIERIGFVLAPGSHANFSRDARVTAIPQPASAPTAQDTAAAAIAAGESLRNAPPQIETITGTILRVHQTAGGHEIRTDQLGIPATLGANLQTPAKVVVVLENGDDQPLPIARVELQMRQRRLCFDAGPATAAGIALFYGDPALQAPVYDYERLFRAEPQPIAATLGPELPNPLFRPRPAAQRPFTERHPETLWVALIAAICVLGVVALRSARRITH